MKKSGAGESQGDCAPLPEDSAGEHTLCEMRPISSSIPLVESDPEWPRHFQLIAGAIKSTLGNRVLRIEHVGSTSVPDLIAKPIIDVLLVVVDSAKEPDYVPSLELGGYRLRIREPEWYEHRMLTGPENAINLHLFSHGCEEIDRMISFRNWLRANSVDRALYARTKRALAKQEWKHTQDYAAAKTEVIEDIMSRVRAAEMRHK